MFNPDFKDMLSALSAEGVEYLVVGAYAMAAHGIPRATGDLDLWIRRTEDNAGRVLKALAVFGAPTEELNVDDLTTPDLIFQIGLRPNRVDLLTSVDGVSFEEAWPGRLVTEVEGVEIAVMGLDDLIRNKEAVGRPRDRADAEELARIRSQRRNPE